ncbi:MAG: alpha/beta hydrolase [Sulfurospirillum sp.]|nr:MAG: alpha/beta hydrolase [Sulfurospirillum sp.]
MRYLKIVWLFLFMMTGCSQKIANTWQKRIVERPLHEGRTLYANITGKGAPLVMLHGFGASSYSFSKIIPELSRYFKIYAIDLKGFGNSPKPDDNRYSVYDQAVLVERFLQKHHLDHVILLGHSYGGGVALSLALMDPKRIAKLVLIDSASYDQQLPKLIRWLTIPVAGKVGFYLLPASVEVKESYKYAFYDDKKIPKEIVREYAHNLYKPNARKVYLQTVETLVPEDIRKISARYRHIKIPTLIIWGRDDIVIRKEKAYRLHHDIQNSELKIIPHCGHIPHEERPEEVLRILKKFLLKN